MTRPSARRAITRTWRASLGVALLLAAAAPDARASCGAESCALDNTTLAGRPRRLSFELSYQHLDQDHRRSGTERLDASGAFTAGGEVRTRSRVVTGKATLALGARGLLSASIPFVDRHHAHVTTDTPLPELREWEYRGLGDAMLLGTWSILGGGESSWTLAINGGVKLPTGRRKIATIEGESPEPHALPGTGSTDLLAGAQAVVPLGAAGGSPLFASVLYLHTGHGTDRYRVGRMVEASAGLAHPLATRLRLLGQLNLRWRGRDHLAPAGGAGHHLRVGGPRAAHGPDLAAGEVEGTGGTALFATPGLRYEMSPALAVSGYVQLPLHQRVNEIQIVAPYHLWMGLSYRLP